MRKKVLAMLLAVIMFFVMTPPIPAHAAGSELTVVDEEHGISFTFSNCLKTVTGWYPKADSYWQSDELCLGEPYPVQFTFYVLEDYSSSCIEALPGREYAPSGYNWEDFRQNQDTYMDTHAWYRWNCGLTWSEEFQTFRGLQMSRDLEFLTGPIIDDRYGASISEPDLNGYMHSVGSDDSMTFYLSESNFARLVPYNTEPTDPGPETPTTPSFTDVPSGQYYTDAVAWAVEKGITTGATSTTFDPNGGCTRAQIVTFLWRAYGEQEPTSAANPFTDVKPSDYYYKAVLWAVEKGITTGATATTFNPGGPCTRDQAVTFQWRAAGKPAATGSGSFTDVSAGSYYADAVAWAVSGGITNGATSTTFNPGGSCTRGQIVTFLYREMG